jgi:HSP20 family protein
MSLIRYRPFPVTSLQDQINRMFDEFDRQFFEQNGEGLGGGAFAPAMDVKEDADAYTVHLEVPGLKSENIQLSLQDNALTVRGMKEQKAESGDNQYRRVERIYGSFARSITLPRPVDGSKVAANLEHGVLTIVLPKLEEAKPRQISIGGSATVTGDNGISGGRTVTVASDSSSDHTARETLEEVAHTDGANTSLTTEDGSDAPAPTNPSESSPDDPKPTGEHAGQPS